MADNVFRVTYARILSPEQMEYMMEWMYSEDSLKGQIGSEGRRFWISEFDGEPCGYISAEYERRLDDGRKLFHLQKIYVLPEYQGRGIGEAQFRHVIDYLRGVSDAPFRVELNVNRDNKAVGFYERMGMKRDRQGDFPIGLGYYMNDYIYALDVD